MRTVAMRFQGTLGAEGGVILDHWKHIWQIE